MKQKFESWNKARDAYCLENGVRPATKFLWQRLVSKGEHSDRATNSLQAVGDFLKKDGTISGKVKRWAIALIKRHHQISYVYCIWYRVNSRAYVGQITNLDNREFYLNTPASYREEILSKLKKLANHSYKGAGVPISQFVKEVVR